MNVTLNTNALNSTQQKPILKTNIRQNHPGFAAVIVKVPRGQLTENNFSTLFHAVETTVNQYKNRLLEGYYAKTKGSVSLFRLDDPKQEKQLANQLKQMFNIDVKHIDTQNNTKNNRVVSDRTDKIFNKMAESLGFRNKRLNVQKTRN